MPDLYSHFQYNDIETHMFASQWFLTLFTAKFPLPMVYCIMDLFLCHVSESVGCGVWTMRAKGVTVVVLTCGQASFFFSKSLTFSLLMFAPTFVRKKGCMIVGYSGL